MSLLLFSYMCKLEATQLLISSLYPYEPNKLLCVLIVVSFYSSAMETVDILIQKERKEFIPSIL